MKTKTQLCQEIKERFSDHSIYNCSSLAVAKEFLGELNQEEIEYSKGRGGAGITAYPDLIPPELLNECNDLRDVLKMLPD